MAKLTLIVFYQCDCMPFGDTSIESGKKVVIVFAFLGVDAFNEHVRNKIYIFEAKSSFNTKSSLKNIFFQKLNIYRLRN